MIRLNQQVYQTAAVANQTSFEAWADAVARQDAHAMAAQRKEDAVLRDLINEQQ